MTACGSSGRPSVMDAPSSTPDGLADSSIDGLAIDAPDIDAPVADAALDAFVPCSTLGSECAPGGLLTCTQMGQNPAFTHCAWGCVSAPTPHCGELHPTGGALLVTDLREDAALSSITITSATTINSDTGEIAGVRAAGPGVASGIDFSVRNGIGTFRMRSFDLRAAVDVVGSNAIAIAATHNMTINGFLDVSVGTCSGRAAKPGGGAGGAPGSDGSGPGKGRGALGTALANAGGGGGAYGGNGGVGGDGYDFDGNFNTAGGAGGTAFGDDAITLLRGGSGGGGGGGATGGDGGAGGGAIQLVANGDLSIGTSSEAWIRAQGCVGNPISTGYSVEGGGGGGGAGGTIVLEASRIFSTGLAYVLANGGKGGNQGGGAGGSSPLFGGMNDGRFGDSAMNAGGGGGGTGRIRVNSPGLASLPQNQTIPTPTLGTGDIR